VYALGVALFEMLTGRTPFSDASVYKLMLDVVQSEVPDVREINSDIDPGVAAILAKMLIKDPAKRYQSMHELIRDLEKHPLVANGEPLKLGIRTTAGGDTSLNMPLPPAASSVRAHTPPPVMDRRGPLGSTQSTPAPATATPSGATTPPPPDMEAVPTPAPASAMAAAAAASPPALRLVRGTPWGGIVVFLITAAVAVSGWLYREQLTTWMDTNAPGRNRLVALWAGLRGVGHHSAL
jgi:serine/threonine-protein kinase